MQAQQCDIVCMHGATSRQAGRACEWVGALLSSLCSDYPGGATDPVLETFAYTVCHLMDPMTDRCLVTCKSKETLVRFRSVGGGEYDSMLTMA